MALEKLATLTFRARRRWQLAVLLIVAMMAVGCGQHRQSYRPIYGTPVVSSPSETCVPGATVTTDDTGTPPASSVVPSLPGAAGTDSSVPSASSPAGASSGPARSSPVESQPKSRIGEEPGLEEVTPPSSSKSSPPGAPSPAKPSNLNQRPALEAPNSSPASRNSASYDDAQTNSSPPKSVRSASLKERLRPYISDASSNELYYPNKVDRPWRYIVLHHSASAAGDYDQIDREHRKILGFDGCGYHFVIGNGTGSGDGQIEVAQRWTNQKQGVHCRNARTPEVDEYGIGICLVGNFEHEPPTPRQVAATQALVAYLSQRYHIAQTRVTTHAHLAATPTICPGKYFPTQSILAAAQDAASARGRRIYWTAVREASRTN